MTISPEAMAEASRFAEVTNPFPKIAQAINDVHAAAAQTFGVSAPNKQVSNANQTFDMQADSFGSTLSNPTLQSGQFNQPTQYVGDVTPTSAGAFNKPNAIETTGAPVISSAPKALPAAGESAAASRAIPLII